MAGSGNSPRCGVCDAKLVKNGVTSAGRTRWRCKACGSSTTQQRPDISRRADLAAFTGWLLGKHSQAEYGGGTGRSFRAKIAWCWDIGVPQPQATGEIHRQVIVDGTYFAGWCVLIAHNGRHVIGWQWCNTENKTAWGELIRQFPTPDVVVTDGGTGLRSALDTFWSRTKIQRCYFHIFAAVRRHTTSRPRLPAGKEILDLTRQLMTVSDLDAAAEWMGAYVTWETRWAALLTERTYASSTTERPSWARPSQRWWYTHIRLRRVQGLYRQLVRDQALFPWLDDAYLDHGQRTVDRTTSRLEGGPNNAIKHLLRHHRGLSNTHAPRAVDWLLNSLTEHPHDPWQLAKQHLDHQHATPASQPPDEPIGPERYGTGLTAEEGLWTRKGWAGRS